jgi:hypothetical protein
MIVRKAGVRSRSIEGGELALMNDDDTTLVLLNELGAVVWELCSREQSMETLTATLSERFPQADEQVIRADVAAFVDRLRELDLLDAS